LSNDILLSIKDLKVEYQTRDAVVKAVNGISFDLKSGETIGIVGETGAGKTTTAYSILRILPQPVGKIVSGSIEFDGTDILNATVHDMRKIRGAKISIIFQDPMTSLNPILTVGQQIAEVLQIHFEYTPAEVQKRVDEMLELVNIPKERKNEYPHQFSGGMRQRIVIAIALACNPKLLIADEPTTALDVTIQAQVLEMMNQLKQKFNTSMIFITHDLGVVVRMCDKVAIMYAGEIIEFGAVEALFTKAMHPYTKGLFGSIPNMDEKTDKLVSIPGLMPDPANLPSGCAFHTRCSEVMEQCKTQAPCVSDFDGHTVRCHLYSKGGDTCE